MVKSPNYTIENYSKDLHIHVFDRPEQKPKSPANMPVKGTNPKPKKGK